LAAATSTIEKLSSGSSSGGVEPSAAASRGLPSGRGASSSRGTRGAACVTAAAVARGDITMPSAPSLAEKESLRDAIKRRNRGDSVVLSRTQSSLSVASSLKPTVSNVSSSELSATSSVEYKERSFREFKRAEKSGVAEEQPPPIRSVSKGSGGDSTSPRSDGSSGDAEGGSSSHSSRRVAMAAWDSVDKAKPTMSAPVEESEVVQQARPALPPTTSMSALDATSAIMAEKEKDLNEMDPIWAEQPALMLERLYAAVFCVVGQLFGASMLMPPHLAACIVWCPAPTDGTPTTA
jgi:hypothetical protein